MSRRPPAEVPGSPGVSRGSVTEAGSERVQALAAGSGASALPLYTPARAAEVLAVRESWLRRRAAERRVPCTFLGKHLRFSHADVVAIAAAGAHPIAPVRRPPIRRR